MKYGLMVIFLFLILTRISMGDEISVNKNLNQIQMSDAVLNKWRACTVDNDCIAAVRGCWAWEPINKKYIKDFLACSNYSCRRSLDPGPQPVTVCTDKVCKATKQTTNVRMDEWLQTEWSLRKR